MRRFRLTRRPPRRAPGCPAAGRGHTISALVPRAFVARPGACTWAVLVAAAALLGASAAPLAAQSGEVTGRVIDAGTGEPLANTRVVVVGTELGVLADDDGAFHITDVPGTAREIRVTHIGYREATVAFELEADGTTEVEVRMVRARSRSMRSSSRARRAIRVAARRATPSRRSTRRTC